NACGSDCRQLPTATAKTPARNPNAKGFSKRVRTFPGPYLPHLGAGQAYGNTVRKPGLGTYRPMPASRFDHPRATARRGVSLRLPTAGSSDLAYGRAL